MFPTVPSQRLVELYSVFGGIPAYLGFYNVRKNLWSNIAEQIFPSDAFLYIEEGRTSLVMDAIKKDFPAFVGPVFEDIARACIRRQGIMGIPIRKAGTWWEKNTEIDIAAFDEKDRMIIGECKWSNKKVGVDIYRNLLLKKNHMIGYARDFRYVLFSKSGYTDDMKKLARDDGVVLYSLDDVVGG